MNFRIGKHRDLFIVVLAAVVVRMAVVVWAARRFPPAADGDYYHVIAGRIAQGLGYTWLWPDGALTYAAHYPVGYPALLGAVYALFGLHPWVGMVVNALLGTLAAGCAHQLAVALNTRKRALAVGLLVALHVALVPYTAALMTEGAVAALWTLSALLTMKAKEHCSGPNWARGALFWLGGLALVLGLAILMRPQTLLLLPALAWLSTPHKWAWSRRLLVAFGVCLATSLTFSPWILRNQVRMGEAGLSFNGGWNLLIGSDPDAKGTFAPLVVPEACKNVFDEAEKDSCFGRAAAVRIADDPLAWLSLAPEKLGATFNYCGAAGWYLHASNPQAFPYSATVALGTIETLFVRLLLMAALIAMAFCEGPRRKVRIVVSMGCALTLLTTQAWVSVVGLLMVLLLFGKGLEKLPTVVPVTTAALAVTVFSHVVFFGGGRYALVLFPLLTVLAGGLRSVDEAEATPPIGDNQTH